MVFSQNRFNTEERRNNTFVCNHIFYLISKKYAKIMITDRAFIRHRDIIDSLINI